MYIKIYVKRITSSHRAGPGTVSLIEISSRGMGNSTRAGQAYTFT